MDESVTSLRALLIEDDERDAKLVVRWLEKGGYALESRLVDTEEALRRALDEWTPEIVLSDHSMPKLDSLRGIRILRERGIDAPVILVSGTIGEEAAVEVIRQGASDFVSKFNPARLAPAVERALEANRLRREHERARQALVASERKYRSLFRDSPDGILITVGDRVTDCNERAPEILGRTREQLLEVRIGSGLLSPPAQPDGTPSIEELSRRKALALAGEPQRFEWQIRRGDGTLAFLDVVYGLLEQDGESGLHVILRDITEQITAQEALGESEARYRYLFDHMLHGVVLLQDDRFVDCNAAAATTFGHPPDELIGMTPLDLSPELQPDGQRSADKARAMIEHALAGEQQSFEWAHRASDGREILAHIHLGRVDGITGANLHAMVEDITERRTLEQRERAHHAMLQGISDGTSDIIFVKDLEGRYIHINRAGAEAMDRPVEEMLGCTDAEIFPPHKAASIAAHDGQVLESGEIDVLEEQVELGGVERLLQTIKGVCRDADGDAIGVFGIARDVTEQRALEQREREQFAMLSGISEGATDVIFVKDRDGRYLHINSAGARFLGREVDKILGSTDEELFPPEDAQRMRADDLRTLETGGTFSIEETAPSGGDTRFLQTTKGVCRDADGSPIGVFGIARDVTEQRRLEQRERQQFAVLEGILGGTTDAVYVLDLAGRVIHVNEASAAIMGRPVDELLGATLAELFPREQAARVGEHHRSVLTSGEPILVEEQVAVAEGERLFSAVIGPCRDHEGGMIGTFTMARDVTEQRRLAAERQKLSRALEQSGDAVIITDHERRIEYVNPAFERITGYAAAEVIGKTPRMLRSGRTDPGVRARFEAAIAAGEPFHGVFVNRRRNGELYYADMSMGPVRDDAGEVTHFIATHYDVTEKLRTERELERLTYYDPVTGLGNRHLMRDRLEQLLSRLEEEAARIAVLHIDLDGFGKVNESFGQAVGDQVLQAVGARLTELGGGNASVGCAGADSFVVLVSLEAPEELAEHVVERLQAGIAEPIRVEGHDIRLTASIGVAFAPEDSGAAEELLQRSEAALHRAKEAGSEQVAFYAQGMTRAARHWVETHADLRRALEQEQFRLEYQPKICLDGGRIEGAEALLRWEHPERGRIPPDQFVPLLEKTGLIVPVGEWVMRAACRQAGGWCAGAVNTAAEPAPRVSVNLSLEQFRQRDLAATVQEVLDDTGTEPAALELELTESSLARDPDKAVKTLETLRELGVTVALDDFGKGYSSLTYLRRFPIDVLKIDREFIRWITESTEDAAILRSVLQLARDLGIEAVAEGVETAEQLCFLMAEGCRCAQGYYFTRPLPPDEFERLLGSGERFALPDPPGGS